MNYIKTLKYLNKVMSPYDKHGIMSKPLKYLRYNLKNAPRKLYKFRACTDINFDNLENENIFLTQASSFSDELDVSLLFDGIEKTPDKKIIKLYKKECLSYYTDNFYLRYDDLDELDITPIEVKKLLEKNYDNNFKFSPKKISRIILKQSKFLARKDVFALDFKSKAEKRKRYEELLNMYIEVRTGMAIKLDDIFSKYGQGEQLANRCKEHYASKLKSIKEGTRKDTYVHSLCSDFKNLSMWEKYADFHKGFCVEYTLDMEKAVDAFMKNKGGIEMIESLYNLFPVSYLNYNKKQKVLSSYKFLSTLYDYSSKRILGYGRTSKILSLYKHQELIKRKDFDFEKEWRIILFNINNQVIHFPLTSSIIIGRDISDENLDKLISISKKLNVPAYKQTIDKNNNSYDYILIKE